MEELEVDEAEHGAVELDEGRHHFEVDVVWRLQPSLNMLLHYCGSRARSTVTHLITEVMRCDPRYRFAHDVRLKVNAFDTDENLS